MNYYKAREQDTPPYLVFDLVATSAEELELLNLTEDPLVVNETRLTDPADPGYISFEFGVCHLRIQNDTLVARQTADIDEAEQNKLEAERVAQTKELERGIGEEFFTYDTMKFPMTPGAVILYLAIFGLQPATFTVMSTGGEVELPSSAIDGFRTAYYTRVIELANLAPPG